MFVNNDITDGNKIKRKIVLRTSCKKRKVH